MVDDDFEKLMRELKIRQVSASWMTWAITTNSGTFQGT